MKASALSETNPSPRQPQRVLAGLVGRGIQKSRSPLLHEQEGDAQGLRLVYTLFDFEAAGWTEEDLPRLLDALQLAGFAGVNVTHPYKQAVIPLLDGLSDQAQRIGAVNTISFAGGRRTGHNTDVTGFAASFRRGLPGVSTHKVVQMGAGGAGAATAHALLGLGVDRLVVFDPDPGRVTGLVDALDEAYGADRVEVGSDLGAAIADASGIVNATPLGMLGHPGTSVPPELLKPALWVADIVYVPLETELLRDARATGCATLDGSGMAVFQAVDAFQIFTGRPADPERMRASFFGAAQPSAAAGEAHYGEALGCK